MHTKGKVPAPHKKEIRNSQNFVAKLFEALVTVLWADSGFCPVCHHCFQILSSEASDLNCPSSVHWKIGLKAELTFRGGKLSSVDGM